MGQDLMKSRQAAGIWNGIFAYLVWGVLPLYWIAVGEVSAPSILAHRIIWSFVFMIFVLIILKKWRMFLDDFRFIFSSFSAFLSIFLSSLLISANWFIYIWAVNAGHVIETSLGYYINPLINVLLGTVVLKEKLDFGQKIAFALAGIAVLILTIDYGTIPWISLSLALTFGLYGLAKKRTSLSSYSSLTFETLAVTPIALFYLIYVHLQGEGFFGASPSMGTIGLLMGAGVVTAIPLLLFAEGAKRITLTLIGMLQYISPTINLLIGIFILHEHFTRAHIFAFSFIWVALLVFSLSRPVVARNKRKKNSVA